MRIKKAVLLVLNNKTKGSVLSTNGVHAVLNPTKIKVGMLSDNEVIQLIGSAYTDEVLHSENITKVLFYNRSFTADSFDEIEVINITFAKSATDATTTSDNVVMSKGKNLLDLISSSEQSAKTVYKVFADVDAHVDRFIISLTKNVNDINSLGEVFSKIVSKALSETSSKNDFAVITSSKSFSEAAQSSDSNALSFTKDASELNEFIESIIINNAKVFQETNNVIETISKNVSKEFENEYLLSDSPSLNSQKSQSDLVQFADFALNEINKAFIEINNAVESLILNSSKILQEIPSIEDTPQLSTSKVFSDFFSSVDSVVATLIKERFASDEFTTTDQNAILNITKGLQEVGILTETTLFDISKILNDNYSISEQLSNYVTKVLGPDLIELTDVFEKTISKLVNDNMTSAEQATLQFAKVLDDLNEQLDVIAKTLQKSASDNIQFSDTITQLLTVNRFPREEDYQDYTVDETYFLEDYVRSGLAIRNLDRIALDLSKSFSEENSIQENIIVSIAKIRSLTEAITYLESSVLSFEKAFVETPSYSEAVTKDIQLSFTESIQLLDLINIYLTEIGKLSDSYATSSSGLLVSQNYVESAGYDLESYFLEDYAVVGAELYFSEDYVGESRILT